MSRTNRMTRFWGALKEVVLQPKMVKTRYKHCSIADQSVDSGLARGGRQLADIRAGILVQIQVLSATCAGNK